MNKPLKIENLKDFSLEHILDCGQCFRWSREKDGSYTGTAFGKVLNIKESPSPRMDVAGDLVDLEIDNGTPWDWENIWHSYFDLGRDYGPIKEQLGRKDPVMAAAIRHGHGIRILNQDKWEAIVSFLISQNNNIPRIRKCIETLCENFGADLGEYRGKRYYHMPTPKVLAGLTEEDLLGCRLGYRARYIIETARQVEREGISETFDYLNTLCGVGPKVANCVLLFSMKRVDCFPIDVWVRRVMHQLYGLAESDTKAMQGFAEENFGAYGGIAQQYLFYYIRERQK